MLVKSFTYVILHYSERIDITRVKILVFHMFEIVQLCVFTCMIDVKMEQRSRVRELIEMLSKFGCALCDVYLRSRVMIA